MFKKYYITTPIYYVNDVPHIGHAYTSVATDCLARFKKMEGFDVRFQTGTDEHGLKIQKAADKLNVLPIELCDKNSKVFEELTKLLNLSNNDFIRTTESRHIEGAQNLWEKLQKNNQIYLDEYEGWYSINDETFYNEKDLIKGDDGKFKTPTGGPVDWITEKSYFFKLSEWSNKLLELYKNNPDFIKPESKRKEVISFVEGGLKDLSVSRTSFKWGIETPNDPEHFMYVWLDALTCYPNGVGYLSNKDNELIDFWSETTHIVGKDILRHHAIYWPAFLLAANLKLPKRIFAHGWWTNEGNKISKSLGNVIDPISIISEYGLDQFRYFILREVPFGNDGDFSIKSLKNRINSDLSNDLGNLCQRSLSMIHKNLNGVIPGKVNRNSKEDELLKRSEEMIDESITLMNDQKIHEYIKLVWDYINEVNKYFNDQKPWELIKDDIDRFNTVLNTTCELIKRIAIFIYPIMPDTSDKIFNMINISNKDISFLNIDKNDVDNIKINPLFQLFPRVD